MTAADALLKMFQQSNPVEPLNRMMESGNINLKSRLSQAQIKIDAQVLFLEASKAMDGRFPDPVPILGHVIANVKQTMASYKGQSRSEIVQGMKGLHVEIKDSTNTDKTK